MDRHPSSTRLGTCSSLPLHSLYLGLAASDYPAGTLAFPIPPTEQGTMPTKSPVHTAVRALVALLVAVSLPGCGLARTDRGTDPRQPDGSADDRPGVRSTGRISVDGRIRAYRLYQPSAVGSGDPVPLVVMLHGGFGTGEQAESAYGWDALADREGVLVAYPDGVGRAWNVGDGCCGGPGRSGVDDVRFIEELVRNVSADHAVDPARVFATGISNGGMMAYRLACDSDVFAAIGGGRGDPPRLV
jgi:polyhydroxybutyrate depolymerase